MITVYHIYTKDDDEVRFVCSRSNEWDAADTVDELMVANPENYYWYVDDDV